MNPRPSPDPPTPGQVVRYAYLWREDAERGETEGRKDRLCAVILAVRQRGDQTIVLVAPITHTPPIALTQAVEVPSDTKRRLGLDDARSWIVTQEVNAFTWPGPDLRPVMRRDGSRSFTYGILPAALTRRVVDRVLASLRAGQTIPIVRDEAP